MAENFPNLVKDKFTDNELRKLHMSKPKEIHVKTYH